MILTELVNQVTITKKVRDSTHFVRGFNVHFNAMHHYPKGEF